MIITTIISGLGNQMFQYAAGYALAQRHQVPLRLDLRAFHQQTLRRYELGRFNISATEITPYDRLKMRFSHPIKRGGPLRHLFNNAPVPRFRVFYDTNEGPDPRVIAAPDQTLLVGYWQNEDYFADHADAIRNQFAFREPPDPQNAAMLGQIQAAETSICVHVRRGDYLSNAEIVTASPLQYYIDALTRMRDQFPTAHYFVFSDDPDWCRANLPVAPGSTFVTHNTGIKDPEDLRLMTACSHFIIANSTFSWWGAWLASNPRKVVIAPRRWFKETNGNEQHIVPSRWMRM